jgi:hypothetical protein
MKSYRAKSGPFSERTFISDDEIENTCTDELRAVGLYPDAPSPIRIDRFVEKRFSVTPEYGDLPEGVLGLTKFGPKGVQSVIIARTLDDEGTATAERRIRTTIAHEAGHGLFHTHLLLMATREHPLFADFTDPKSPRVLCRDVPNKAGALRPGYDGRWWEYQANRTIGPLLMPRPLVRTALEPLLEVAGSLGIPSLPERRRPEAVGMLAEIFEVNPAAAKIRLEDIFPVAKSAQLRL